MPLSAGDKLGPYEILASIGAGGMGQVYSARDARLNRDVAIKVSGEQFSERFESEARAIAALIAAALAFWRKSATEPGVTVAPAGAEVAQDPIHVTRTLR